MREKEVEWEGKEGERERNRARKEIGSLQILKSTMKKIKSGNVMDGDW